MESAAILSECNQYRYVLTRTINQQPEVAVFIMLNPSTADAKKDDPTIRRCVEFTRRWGCGKLIVINLFAYRATSPQTLKIIDNPIGNDNQHWVEEVVKKHPERIVCAWGNDGIYMEQDLKMMGWLKNHGVQPQALKISKQGQPHHPLYVPYDVSPLPYFGREGRD